MFHAFVSYRRSKKNEEIEESEYTDSVDLIWAIVGKCSITYDSLYKLSLSEVIKIGEGKNSEIKEHWEMARDVSYWSFKGHAKKKSLKKTDLMKFPWDKKKEMSESKVLKVRSNAGKLRDLIKNGKVKFKV